MVVLDNAIFCGGNVNSHLFFLLENRSRKTCSIVALAKKTDNNNNNNLSEKSTTPPLSLPLKLSTSLIAQSAIGVFALGFVDAGFSGDWSRIGVISKETEYFLKLAAYSVVPFCFFLVLWLFKNQSEED